MSNLHIKGDYVKVLQSEKPIRIVKKVGKTDEVIVIAPLNTDIRFSDFLPRKEYYENKNVDIKLILIVFFILLILVK